MCYPPLVIYETEAEYKQHYIDKYCRAPITTFDNYQVSFIRERFEHVFYKSSQRNDFKDYFSRDRAERIDWIKQALQDPTSDRRAGWDKYKKRNDFSHRVSIVVGNYVVVIRILDRTCKKANFVTAYIADADALVKILRNPKWK